MIAVARRMPSILGLLLGFAAFEAGHLEAPQELANEGYRKMWQGDASAAEWFRRAAEADPAMPYRWSDLAVALSNSGDTKQRELARYCFGKSLELGPASPQLTFRAASFHFENGEAPPGLELGSRVLAETSEFDEMVFSAYRQFGGGQEQIRRLGIRANRRAAESYFRYLAGRGDRAEASEMWRWLETAKNATVPQARFWADWLLRHDAPAAASEVWQRHLAAGYQPGNRVFEGGFEGWSGGEAGQEARSFDWQTSEFPGVHISRDLKTAHTGAASLRLDFTQAENVDFHHVGQRLWLNPGRYRLTAWVRTDRFSTDEGLRLRVEDGGLRRDTESLTGTNDWTPVAAAFTVSAPAHMVWLRLHRAPSWNFENRPRGTVWVDDVVLRELP